LNTHKSITIIQQWIINQQLKHNVVVESLNLGYDEVYSPHRQYGQYSYRHTNKQTDRQTDTNTIKQIQ